MNSINMNDIMQSSLGESNNELTVNFKKTVLIREYETEVIEATSSIKFDKPLNGIERMFITAILQIQMEYTSYINLATKGLVTQTQLSERKSSLEEDITILKLKAEALLGAGALDKYLKSIGDANG